MLLEQRETCDKNIQRWGNLNQIWIFLPTYNLFGNSPFDVMYFGDDFYWLLNVSNKFVKWLKGIEMWREILS